MDRTLLEQWLCGAGSIPPSPFTVACALGLPIDVADTTLLRTVPRVRSLRFVLAVLQDLFPDDVDVQIWLDARRPEFRGQSARETLLTGQTGLVEQLVVAAWNDRGDQTTAQSSSFVFATSVVTAGNAMKQSSSSPSSVPSSVMPVMDQHPEGSGRMRGMRR